MERVIFNSILGNCHDPAWRERLKGIATDHLVLDRWTAQKSRFIGRTRQGEEVAVVLNRSEQLRDGDILRLDPASRRALVVELQQDEVFRIDLTGLNELPGAEQRQRLFELGHAIGNQHWPAVMHDDRIYVPLTVDRKVMQSVMETHRFEGISFRFESGSEVIPYLSPHEVRRLFAGSHPHAHHEDHKHHEEHE